MPLPRNTFFYTERQHFSLRPGVVRPDSGKMPGPPSSLHSACFDLVLGLTIGKAKNRSTPEYVNRFETTLFEIY